MSGWDYGVKLSYGGEEEARWRGMVGGSREGRRGGTKCGCSGKRVNDFLPNLVNG
jgi:hypothetical protein